MNSLHAKPFIKWVGGKTQLLSDIERIFPYGKTDKFTYIEPFVGGGAVLFQVLSNFPNIKNVIINDSNEDLINVYKTIKYNITDLIPILKQYEDEYHLLSEHQIDKRKYYHAKREIFNTRESNTIPHAALFIFLNKTCFNGLYRVNKQNKFNSAIGDYTKPIICDIDNLLSVSGALQAVDIICDDFEHIINYIDSDTIVYLDPPYKSISKSDNIYYSPDKFTDSEQCRLKLFCDKLTSNGTKFILSNSDVIGSGNDDEFFDKLFNGYKIDRVSAKRNINPTKQRQVSELLISNISFFD